MSFSSCDNLTSVIIPDGVTSIGANPFLGCGQLQTIQVSPDHPVLATIDGVLFEKTTKTLICYPGGLDAAEYAIPEGILSIGENAFCENLTSVTISDGVTSILSRAFANCANLTSVSIPDSVTFIGNYAFSNCSNLTGITIPDSITSIGDSVFFYCISLTSVTIPNSVTSIGTNPFSGCSQLQITQISPDHPVLATIDGVLFEKTTKTLICYPVALDAAEYAIPEGILSIGDAAFLGCKNLNGIFIPDSILSIGDSAFLGCDNLTSVTIPDSVTFISAYAFSGCGNLTSVTIPDSVTSIGVDAFSGCSDNLVLTVGRDSYAKSYAEENGISYTYPDANDWLNS